MSVQPNGQAGGNFEGFHENIKQAHDTVATVKQTVSLLLSEELGQKTLLKIVDDHIKNDPKLTQVMYEYLAELKQVSKDQEDPKQQQKINAVFGVFADALQSHKANHQKILDEEQQKIALKEAKKEYAKKVVKNIITQGRNKIKNTVSSTTLFIDKQLYAGGGVNKSDIQGVLDELEKRRSDIGASDVLNPVQKQELLRGLESELRAYEAGTLKIKSDGVVLATSLMIPSGILGTAVANSFNAGGEAAVAAGLLYYIIMYINDSKAINQLNTYKHSKDSEKQKNTVWKMWPRIAIILITSWMAAEYIKPRLFAKETDRALQEEISQATKQLELERENAISEKRKNVEKLEDIAREKEKATDVELDAGSSGRGRGYGNVAREKERRENIAKQEVQDEKNRVQPQIDKINEIYDQKIAEVPESFSGEVDKIKALNKLIFKKGNESMAFQVLGWEAFLLLLELLPLVMKMRRSSNTMTSAVVLETEKNEMMMENKHELFALEQGQKTRSAQLADEVDKMLHKQLEELVPKMLEDFGAVMSDPTIDPELKARAQEYVDNASENARKRLGIGLLSAGDNQVSLDS